MATVSHTHEWKPVRSSFRSREDWSLKWWITFALLLSLVFHGFLIVAFETLGVSSRTVVLSEAPPDRVQINPELLRQQQAITEIPEIIADGKDPAMDRFEPNLDDFDKAQMLPENQEIDLTPSVREIVTASRRDLSDEGNAPVSGLKMADLLGPQSMSTADLAQEMAAVRKEVLAPAVSEKQMLLDASALDASGKEMMDMNLLNEVKEAGKGKEGDSARVKGFSNLDDLLGQGGGKLGGSTAPILMPTDLLFEYGSSELAEGSKLSLMKLGFLIQKNPNSIFIVEGHTDSHGSFEFNLDLSLRRATAVVQWLRESLRLGTDRIQAVGKGKTELLVQAGASVEEQSLNRRVEIKVRNRP